MVIEELKQNIKGLLGLIASTRFDLIFQDVSIAMKGTKRLVMRFVQNLLNILSVEGWVIAEKLFYSLKISFKSHDVNLAIP